MRGTQAIAAGTTEQQEALGSAVGSMSDHGEAGRGTQLQDSAQARHWGPIWQPEEVTDLLVTSGEKAIL